VADYKRRIYLINPRFQLKFSFYVCVILFISSMIYPLTIYDIMSGFINYVLANNPALTTALQEQKKSLIIILTLWQIGFTGLVFIICILFSHKIAGPIHKLKLHMQAIREGEVIRDVTFRKSDYFSDLAEEFNETFHAIQEAQRSDFMYLSEINSYLQNLLVSMDSDKRELISEIINKLDDIQHRYMSTEDVEREDGLPEAASAETKSES